MPNPLPERVEVTQADRDAAADLCNRFRLQNADCHALVQAFASHRLRTIEEMERIICQAAAEYDDNGRFGLDAAKFVEPLLPRLRSLSTPQEQVPDNG